MPIKYQIHLLFTISESILKTLQDIYYFIKNLFFRNEDFKCLRISFPRLYSVNRF